MSNSFLQFILDNYVFIVLLAGLFVLLVTNKTIGYRWLWPLWIAWGLMSFLFIVDSMLDRSIELLDPPYVDIILTVLSYWIKPLILLLFVYDITPEKYKSMKYNFYMLIPLLANTIIYATAFVPFLSGMHPIAVGINENNEIILGPLGLICFFVSFFYIGVVLCYVSINFGNKLNIGLLMFCAVCCLAAGAFEMAGLKNKILNPTIALTFIFYFIYIYIELTQRSIEQMERTLHEQEANLMLSQIQPHFLYNALTTIKSLCETDPELAGETILHFSRFLRRNMDTLSNRQPVTLETELNHVKNYVAIQKVRFENFDIRYEIEASDFTLPALSIQPLVENAISYGIRTKEHGTIVVHTYKEQNNYVVAVSDDGVGFDLNILNEKDEKRSHVGIESVKNRIELTCHGKFEIVSKIGQGTICTIRIPRTDHIKY